MAAAKGARIPRENRNFLARWDWEVGHVSDDDLDDDVSRRVFLQDFTKKRLFIVLVSCPILDT